VLRLDWNILFNIINLIILYLLMKRFLFKPVNAILEKRQQAADAQFAEADRQKAEAKESQEHYDALVQGAEDEKKRIVADARQEASAEYGRIVSEAKDKADGIVEKAKADAENEKAAAMQQADAAVRDMVVTAAARMVAMKDAKESDRALYDKFLAETKEA
jgi:F-type H+-transporting ATPase subunit b